MFDSTAAATRLARMWSLPACFGKERGSNRVLLEEIVSDRMQLVGGLQVLRDELSFAVPPGRSDEEQCAADLSLPSVVTTLAFTNCGDRIHQVEIANYERIVASRFATLSEIGALKPEAFHPTGGGTDDGNTLAHVTWAHALDEPLRERIYDGNAQSFVMCAFDLKTHVGRLDEKNGSVLFGKTQESPWREPRAACGAVAGALAHFDANNGVHQRLRRTLGEENFAYLSKQGVKTKEGVEITAAVAAAIVAVQGMRDTANALKHEMDERGLSHLTASVTVNRPSMPDTLIYLSRASVFDGEIAIQGFGVDAKKYAGRMAPHESGQPRLTLAYDGVEMDRFEPQRERYRVRNSVLPGDIYV